MSKFHQHEFDLLPELAFRPRGGRRGPMTLEGGGKGGSAPAPDPRLVEAQMRSMGIQDDMIKRITANSDELAPLQKEQLQFGLDSGKAAYDQSQQDRQWMLTRRAMLSGVQDKLVSDATNFDTEAKREELAGLAMADVNQGFSSARGQSARAMAARGVMPGSGESVALDGQMQVQQALALAGGANSARRGARDEGRMLTDRANNALSGYPSMASGQTGSGASFAANGINLANMGVQGLNSGFNTAAGVAGQMGTNATGMFGQQANYKTAQDNANKGEGAGSILGGIGGLAAGAAKLYPLMIGSDRRLKTDIELVGVDPGTGLNLWQFAYLTEPARHFIGVMADEVRKLFPAAVERWPDGFDRVNYGLLGLKMVEI